MHQRHLRTILLAVIPFAVLLLIQQYASAADEKYQLKVVADRADAIYKVGEEARFLISMTENGKPVASQKVSYHVDNFIGGAEGFPKGTIELTEKPAVVKVTSDRPVFLRCIVTSGERKKMTAAVAFSPLEIGPSLPVPDDFDQFWAEQKRKLAEVPAKAKLEPVKQGNQDIACFDVKVDCIDGVPVSGYFGKPKAAKPKSLPAILWVHGAGVRSSALGNAIKGANARMLSMDINAHGIPNGKPKEYYRDLYQGRLRGYRHEGREDREKVYFRGMFLRIVRAIDFLTAQPEWDGKTVIAVGHSQGGGQALVAGGIDERVTFIAAGVPAICDHSGRAAGRINGWPKLVATLADGKPEPKQLQATRYVDAVNFASRCKADAIMSVGFIDGTCPPSSCYAAYNLLKGKKQVINKPLMGHAAPGDIQKAFFDAILDHVKEQTTEK